MGTMNDSLLIKNMPSVADVATSTKGNVADRIEGIEREGTPSSHKQQCVCFCDSIFCGYRKGSLLSMRLCWRRLSQTDTSIKLSPCGFLLSWREAMLAGIVAKGTPRRKKQCTMGFQ